MTTTQSSSFYKAVILATDYMNNAGGGSSTNPDNFQAALVAARAAGAVLHFPNGNYAFDTSSVYQTIFEEGDVLSFGDTVTWTGV